MPGLDDLILDLGLTFSSPAATQEKEKPGKPNILNDFRSGAIVSPGAWS